MNVTPLLTPPPFSFSLQQKLDLFSTLKKRVPLGTLSFSSPLLLAPMSAITDAPFRLFMQDLGSGGAISELISANGTHHQNEKTLKMIRPHPQEKDVGIQFFGEDPHHMATAAHYAESLGVTFVDINLGCPVRKVVTKGAGSALLKELDHLKSYLSIIREAITIPLTIKIRTGWNLPQRNADQVLSMAKEIGIEMVSLHGRTREQQYTGLADWDYIESLAQKNLLPLVGNGDLHSPHQVRERLNVTNCQALMLGRGPLRHPFLFLEGLDINKQFSHITFSAEDHLEIIFRYHYYLSMLVENHHHHLLQLRKIIIWCVAGYPYASQFRRDLFSLTDLNELLKYTEKFFHLNKESIKKIDWDSTFMNGGHG